MGKLVSRKGSGSKVTTKTRAQGSSLRKHCGLFSHLPLNFTILLDARCYNCGGLDHHAKECKLPPQPKKCHFCQSINHVVASCPLKAQQAPSPQGKPAYFPEEEEEIHSSAMLPKAQKSSHSGWGLSFCDQKILRSRHQSAEWRKWGKGG